MSIPQIHQNHKAMKLVYKLTFAFVLAILIAAPLGDATGKSPISKKHEFTKNIKKEFPINSNGTIGLKNKYGKIEVKTWEKNRVKVDVKIIVQAISEASAQTVFDRVNIQFSDARDFVKAETIIGEPKKNVWWSAWDVEDDKTEFKINYVVFMPKSGNLNLTNKYEDSYIEPIDGDVSINISYGNFRLDGAHDLMLTLNHGGGTVVDAHDIVAEIANSNRVRIKKAHDIIFMTNNSRITTETAHVVKIESRNDAFSFEELKKLKFNGRYGDVDITSVQEVYASGRYSDFYIEELTHHADFDLQFGGVTIEKIVKGFDNLTLYGRHTDYKLMVDYRVPFRLDAVAENAGITYPENLSVTHEKDHGIIQEVKGYRGTQNTESTIIAKLNYGGLRIK
jgi:hypothetical protein